MQFPGLNNSYTLKSLQTFQKILNLGARHRTPNSRLGSTFHGPFNPKPQALNSQNAAFISFSPFESSDRREVFSASWMPMSQAV